MKTPKKRRSRHQREATTQAITLTERDLDLFEALYKRRAATAEQLAGLLFGKPLNSYLRTRLASLFHQQYLRRRFLMTPYGIAPSKIIHLLDRKGGRLLAEKRGYMVKSTSEYDTLSQDFLEHSLAITDIEVALLNGCRSLNYILKVWQWERFIKADYDTISVGNGKPHAVQPDSYAAITIPHKLLSTTTHYLVEMDRGTEARRQFEPKIPTYIAYFRSRECRARYGTNKLRVLIVTTSPRRLANIKKITESADGKSRFWFTTLDQLKETNALQDSIWQVAGRDGTFSLLDSTQEKGIAAILAIPFISLSTRSSFR